jgi:hypothetical protein
VRSGGRVILHEDSPQEICLEWWVGGDDRWYEPAVEITTRQELIRDLPIVSVSMRVPSGDAVVSAFTTVQGPRELVVSELTNRSKVPFVAALVVSGPGAIDVTLDGSVIRVGGLPLVHVPTPPQRSAAAPTVEALRSLVVGGGASPTYVGIKGESASAFLFAVTHTLSVKVAAIVGASSPLAFAAAPVLSALPVVHDLANGWDSHLTRGVNLRVVPALPSAPNFRTALSSLLLFAEPAAGNPSTPFVVCAALAAALDSGGFHAEAGALIEDAPQMQGRRGEITDRASEELVGNPVIATALMVEAVARHGAVTHDAVFAQTMAPVVAGGLEYVAKRVRADSSLSGWLACCAAVPAMLRIARDDRAAKQASKIFRDAPHSLPMLPVPPLPAQSRGANFVPEDPLRLANLVGAHINRFMTFDSDAVSILPGFDASMLGQPVDVRNLPTPFGRLSYAVRWHGERPAVLWECAAIHDDQKPEALQLNAPMFADWTGTGARGETLLPAPLLP